MYNDGYATCAETYATLLLDPGDIDPSSITQRLGIEPTELLRRGEPWQRPGRVPGVASINGWFLRSRDHVESRDSRRHVDWLLDRVTPKAEAIKGLQEAGCRMAITCYWLSWSGHGGPTIPPSQMARLAELNIELWFDFYGPFEETFDVFVECFDRGESAGIPRAAIRPLFPVVEAESGANDWAIRYDDLNSCHVEVTPLASDPSLVNSLRVRRPCVEARLWDALLGVLRMGSAALYFPGDTPPLVASEAAGEQLRAEMVEEMGRPRVVRSGQQIVESIRRG